MGEGGRRLEDDNLYYVSELTLYLYGSKNLRLMTSVNGRLPAGNV